MKPSRMVVSALAILALASACESPSYVFRPRPLVVDVAAPEGGSYVARAVLVVLGARPGDAATGRLDEMVLRLSLENLSDEPIGLDPSLWRLVSADLGAFGAPRVEPDPLPSVLPKGDLFAELSFPVLPGTSLDQYDLAGLSLRFGVLHRNATIVVSASFERWLRAPYDPYWYDYAYGPPYGGTVVVGAGVAVGG